MSGNGSVQVLVIDDEELVLESIADYLELEGFEVIATPSAVYGIDVAQTRHPDVILSNFTMPEMDGLSVLQAIRGSRNTADIPFVFFSAHGTHEVREQCLKDGADAFFDKGFDMETIASTIRQLAQQQK